MGKEISGEDMADDMERVKLSIQSHTHTLLKDVTNRVAEAVSFL